MRTSRKLSNKKSSDSIDQLIFEKGVRAKDVMIYKNLDLLLLVLNNGTVVKIKLSDYPKLKKARKEELEDWKLVGGGVGIEWPKLGEDLSVRGFIKNAALHAVLHNLQDMEETAFA